jgi:N-acetylglucosamine malate deacetylase 1
MAQKAWFRDHGVVGETQGISCFLGGRLANIAAGNFEAGGYSGSGISGELGADENIGANSFRRGTEAEVEGGGDGGTSGGPECGCGGTIARYTDLGHEVAVLYLNRGEGYCGREDLKECGRIRTVEAEKACASLKARAVFAGQYDGRAVVDAAHYEEFRRLLDAEKADVVFTQWPVDSHRDHRAISALVLDAWLQSEKKFTLYYYEVAEDTLMFSPTEYVDISGVEARRRAACYAHASQNPDKWYPLQTEITRFRGTQNGWGQAEAFVRPLQRGVNLLP